MLHKCCEIVSESMTAYIDCPEKKDWVTYGLELIVGEFLKFSLILGIAYLMGILPVTALILITALPYRIIIGGGHSTTYLRCSIITISIYLLLSGLANWLIVSVNSGTVLRIFPVVGIIALLVVQVWVPGVEPNTYSQAEMREEKYKKIARIYLIIWIVSCILISKISDSYKVYFVCSMVGMAWQTFFVTPAGYLLLSYSEKVANMLGKKEVQRI